MSSTDWVMRTGAGRRGIYSGYVSQTPTVLLYKGDNSSKKRCRISQAGQPRLFGCISSGIPLQRGNITFINAPPAWLSRPYTRLLKRPAVSFEEVMFPHPRALLPGVHRNRTVRHTREIRHLPVNSYISRTGTSNSVLRKHDRSKWCCRSGPILP